MNSATINLWIHVHWIYQDQVKNDNYDCRCWDTTKLKRWALGVIIRSPWKFVLFNKKLNWIKQKKQQTSFNLYFLSFLILILAPQCSIIKQEKVNEEQQKKNGRRIDFCQIHSHSMIRHRPSSWKIYDETFHSKWFACVGIRTHVGFEFFWTGCPFFKIQQAFSPILTLRTYVVDRNRFAWKHET